jgi:hypothetical protein
MAALREVFARFGFEFDGKQKLADADRGVDKLATGVAAVGAALAGSAVFAGLKDFAAQLDVFDDLSAQTGLATDSIQELTYAAEVNGSSTQEMVGALTLLQKSLGKTTEATGPQVDALKALGVATEDAAGAPRRLADVLPEVFANFSGLSSEAEKARVATDLFGRSGVKLIPTLNRGAEGMAEFRKELDEVGGVVSGDTIAAAGDFRDDIVRMDRALFGLKGTLAASVFPQLSKIITMFSVGVGKMSAFIGQTTLADTATKALSVTLGMKLASALAPYLKSGLKFGAIFLAVDDLLAFLDGKDSLIGRLLDSAFGAGTAAVVRAWVNDAIAQFSRFRDSAEETYQALTDSNASFTTRALATFVGFLRDAAGGFPAFRAGFAAMLVEIGIDLNMAVLNMENRWNAFIGKLSIPDSVKEALSIDTSDTARGVQGAQVDAERLREEQAFHLRGGRDAIDQSTRAQGFQPPAPGAVRKGRTLGAGEAFDVAPMRSAPLPGLGGGAAALPTAPLPGLGGAGYLPAAAVTPPAVNAPTLNQTNHYNVTTADPRAAAREVANQQGGANRSAMAALTQRAK